MKKTIRPSFQSPTSIYIREKEQIISEISLEKNKKILLILSDTMERRAGLLELTKCLENNNTMMRIRNIQANPTDAMLYESLKQLPAIPEKIIGIGGGSAIDLCKGIAAFDYMIGKEFTRENLIRAIERKTYKEKQHTAIQLTAIPTTAGTGSELTSWGTIWKEDKTAKLSIEDNRLIPDCTYLVPELTKYMPHRLTLSTGLDALCHATESYWSKNSNSITREISKTAIKIILDYLPKVLKQPDEILYREKMCMASLFAGLAFSNTKTTACHSISYPLTMQYHIEHGFACAITLVSVLKRNYNEIKDLEDFLEAWKAKGIEDIADWLEQVCSGIINLKLSAFGVTKNDITKIASQASTPERMENNPILLKKEEIENILWENY